MTAGRNVRKGRTSVMGAGVVVGLALAGCSSGTASDAQESPGASEAGKIAVVTSTNVYSDLASQVGGDKVSATPVIDSSAQDPHSYEATPQDRLTVEKADVVVRNGGGYDQFMTDLASENQHVVDAVEASGLQPEEDAHDDHDHASEDHDHGSGHHHHGDFNEHVWYDVESMQKVVDRMAEQLGQVDQQNAQYYRDNAARVKNELGPVEQKVEGIKASGGYIATEPLPGYLLQDAGLHDETPQAFTEAIDAGSDAAPAVLNDTLGLVKGGDVKLLAFNKQTSTGQTDRLRSAAGDAGKPVVEFTETIPDGLNYQQWMTQNADRVAHALQK
ncbi:metal ABC transporter solute-binding protein, Zn/Mn family [Kocuria marina]|uniref:metal ABC transporter solute-binding protein, Zn/Mn family n=1 Tax=Kocuria marina TaxID=223184 RepID=UPI0022DEFBAF|nr:zinc ABC transporter substrate-binding protein [Kocuria marina]